MAQQIDIINELSQNFIDFTYEANSQRAFPDIRDGLKPGQRACLWEFYNKGYLSNKPHVKAAKISGGVIANWWPHGDTAIYETFTRMSQSWINNIPEVDWHGNNGNQIVGPEAASSRYTEARLAKASEEGLFMGIKKENVPMILNFSEDDEWPEVLPAIFPRLMINGSQGIGSTIAQTFLPMNLNELTDIIINYVQTGEINYSSIAPDFPSGGILINKDEVSAIYKTGKGKAIIRARTKIQNNSILITELPYQVYIEPLIDEIKELINKEEISGIDAIYNKSDKKNLLIEIECSGNINNILNKLYSSTSLQKSYNANQWALIGKTPTFINLKDYIDIYLKHNIECYCKEITFDLNKATNRKEIVDGLLKALENIDNIINLIKKSESSKDAKINLINKYNFTERQAKAIVDMKLGSLAHLEAIELEKEQKELINIIQECENILSNKDINLDHNYAFAKYFARINGVKVNVRFFSNNSGKHRYQNSGLVAFNSDTTIVDANHYYDVGLNAIFHEVVHEIQENSFGNSEYNLGNTIDRILSFKIENGKEYYNTNYENILFEVDAKYTAAKMYLDYIQEIAPDVYDNYKHDDGFLYLIYSNEKIWG